MKILTILASNYKLDLWRWNKKCVKENTKILDLKTAVGERVLKNFPDCVEILRTAFSADNDRNSQQKSITEWKKEYLI